MATHNGAVHSAVLRASSALALFEALPDPVVVIRGNSSVVDLNPAAEIFFGYQRSELTATTTLESLCNVCSLYDEINSALKDGNEWQGELRVGTRHRGLRTVNATLRRVFLPSHHDVALTLAVCHDITYRKELEKALLHQSEERIITDRRKNEFVAILSHELRNPLAPITNSLALMRTTGFSDPLLASSHAIIERQVAHLRQMVNSLVDIARLNTGKVAMTMAPLVWQHVIEQALEITAPKIRAAGHQLTLSIAPSAIRINGDLTRLVQALANVLNNAAKFTPGGGMIAVTCGQIDGHAFVVVRDSGNGISAPFKPRLFELFAQADESLARSDGGLGVGLAITREIMTQHDGSISVHSDGVGCGSAFTLQLPLAREGPISPTRETSIGSDNTTAEGFRILLIDDNDDANESMAALLDMMGYVVSTARDGTSALTMATQFKPQLILSDIGLPGMDGYQLAPALRTACGDRKLILVAATGYGNANDRQRSQAAGFDHHLVKPLDADVLLDFLALQAAEY
ncbi:hybrid sensor histidine kinase/response regulator [Actimicrobium antarcticum]